MWNLFKCVLQLLFGFGLMLLFVPTWPELFLVYGAVVCLAYWSSYSQSRRQEKAEQERIALLEDIETARLTSTITDDGPASARAVTAGGRPMVELTYADLKEVDGRATVAGELKNISQYLFSRVVVYVSMRDSAKIVLGEVQASLHQLRPREVWHFSVPSRWPQTDGFNLRADIRIDP